LSTALLEFTWVTVSPLFSAPCRKHVNGQWYMGLMSCVYVIPGIG
jgi:hypothetical protein